MSKKSAIPVNPDALSYVNEEELCGATQEEEFEEMWELGYGPEIYEDPKLSKAFAAWIAKKEAE